MLHAISCANSINKVRNQHAPGESVWKVIKLQVAKNVGHIGVTVAQFWNLATADAFGIWVKSPALNSLIAIQL